VVCRAGHEMVNCRGQEVKGQGHLAPNYVATIPFGQMSQKLSDKFLPNLAGTYYGNCPL